MARAKLVFGPGVQVPKLDVSNTSFNITLGGQGVADLYQDDNNNNIFYFSVPAGTAGPADVTISGISVPGMPWLSATPIQTMPLPSLVQYTDDPAKGIKGFLDSNLVNIEKGKSYVDYKKNNGGISDDDAVALMANIREDAATVQMDLWKTFLDGKTLDQSALTDLQNQASQKNGDFLRLGGQAKVNDVVNDPTNPIQAREAPTDVAEAELVSVPVSLGVTNLPEVNLVVLGHHPDVVIDNTTPQ